MIFRIDDVSVNTNPDNLRGIVGVIQERLPEAKFLLAVSPMVHDVSEEPSADRERAFPRLLSAMSDHRLLFKVARGGVPEYVREMGLPLASHGLVHVDHRLLGREAQELSIVASCSIVGTTTFVPPFNHWNRDTESVCAEHSIELVKFETGWRHVCFNRFDRSVPGKYYLHTHDTDSNWLRVWLSR